MTTDDAKKLVWELRPEELRDVLCVELVQHADTKDRAEKAEAALKNERSEYTRAATEAATHYAALCQSRAEVLALQMGKDSLRADLEFVQAALTETPRGWARQFLLDRDDAPELIRALAPLPAGLCVLSVSSVDVIHRHLARASTLLRSHELTLAVKDLSAALDAAGGER